jgi:hypothetical protein
MDIAAAIIALMSTPAGAAILDKLLAFIMQIFALLTPQQQVVVAAKLADILTGNKTA